MPELAFTVMRLGFLAVLAVRDHDQLTILAGNRTSPPASMTMLHADGKFGDYEGALSAVVVT